LDTCPTHKWEITHEECGRWTKRSCVGSNGHVVVSFPTDEEEEEA